MVRVEKQKVQELKEKLKELEARQQVISKRFKGELEQKRLTEMKKQQQEESERQAQIR